MKSLSLEKMEKVQGGLDVCAAYAFAVLVSNGIQFGLPEAYIIGSIAYNSCAYT